MRIREIDYLRGFCAVYVVLNHYVVCLPDYFRPLTVFGQEIVIIFWLISGFVEGLSRKTNISLSEFILKKAIRIYPAFIFALFFSYLAHSYVHGALLPVDGVSLLANLCNLQDTSRMPGTWFPPYMDNFPIWFLSYQWWFYIMYAISVKTQLNKKRNVLFLAILGVFSYSLFNNQISLFLWYYLIWDIGRTLGSSVTEDGRIDVIHNNLIRCGVVIACMFMVFTPSKDSPIGLYPNLPFRHWMVLLVILLVILFNCYIPFVKRLLRILKVFKTIAPLSYSLFLLHCPILVIVSSSIRNGLLCFIVSLIISVILSYILDVIGIPYIQRYLNGRFRAMSSQKQKLC